MGIDLQSHGSASNGEGDIKNGIRDENQMVLIPLGGPLREQSRLLKWSLSAGQTRPKTP